MTSMEIRMKNHVMYCFCALNMTLQKRKQTIYIYRLCSSDQHLMLIFLVILTTFRTLYLLIVNYLSS